MNLAVFNGYADGATEIAEEKADLWLGEGCLFGAPPSHSARLAPRKNIRH